MDDEATDEQKAAEIATRLIDAAHSVSDDIAALVDEREEVEDAGDAAALVAFIDGALRAAVTARELVAAVTYTERWAAEETPVYLKTTTEGHANTGSISGYDSTGNATITVAEDDE